MELREIHCFITIVKEGNITKAANILHITQPALSRTLTSLEEDIGQTLLVRGKRHVSLTPAGSRFYQLALNMEEMAAKTKMEMQNFHQDIAGDVYFGSGETYAVKIIFEAIQQAMTEHPGIRIHLTTGSSREIKDRLVRNMDDFGLVFGEIDHSRFRSIAIPYEDSWCLLLPRNSELASKNTIRPEDLYDQPLIIAERAVKEGSLRNWLKKDLSELNVRGYYTIGYNLNAMVSAGIGYALVYEKIPNTAVFDDLKTIPLEPSVHEQMHIIYEKDHIFSEAAAIILEEISRRTG